MQFKTKCALPLVKEMQWNIDLLAVKITVILISLDTMRYKVQQNLRSLQI